MAHKIFNILKCRLLRYSTRTMLVVVLVLSTWLGFHANRAARQRRAVAMVEELGGSVTYDCDYRLTEMMFGGQMVRGIGRQSRPDGMFYDLMGVDWFHDVEQVFLFDVDVGNQHIEEVVGGMPQITALHLGRCAFNEAQIKHLGSLKNLELLFLSPVGFGPSDDLIEELRRRLEIHVIWNPHWRPDGSFPYLTPSITERLLP